MRYIEKKTDPTGMRVDTTEEGNSKGKKGKKRYEPTLVVKEVKKSYLINLCYFDSFCS